MRKETERNSIELKGIKQTLVKELNGIQFNYTRPRGSRSVAKSLQQQVLGKERRKFYCKHSEETLLAKQNKALSATELNYLRRNQAEFE